MEYIRKKSLGYSILLQVVNNSGLMLFLNSIKIN